MSDDFNDAAQAPRTARRGHGLGRGLSALLGDAVREEPVGSAASGAGKTVQSIEVALIRPHPEQPRRHFDEGALVELADSIAKRGVIQPIIVRPVDGGYQIVAGERRWRAAQRAHLHRIPALVRDFDDAETLEIALVENIQREDLNAIEEAEAYAKLIADFGHKQDALARLVGKSRSHVANLLRLLDLPRAVQQAVVEGRMQMGHARALIGADDAEALARTVEQKGLSVRETEALARRAKGNDGAERAAGNRSGVAASSRDPDLLALERHLADLLGVKVGIAHRGAGGAVTLSYSTLDQLDMICQRLSGDPI